jgi:hypothetical protein
MFNAGLAARVPTQLVRPLRLTIGDQNNPIAAAGEIGRKSIT